MGWPVDLQEMADFIPAVHPGNVCVLGARNVDPLEKDVVRESGVRVFTMSEIDERGMAACIDEAIARVTSGTAGFHLSFDLDGIDPMIAPGVGTPVPGGLTYREAHLICEKAARSEKLLSLECSGAQSCARCREPDGSARDRPRGQRSWQDDSLID